MTAPLRNLIAKSALAHQIPIIHFQRPLLITPKHQALYKQPVHRPFSTTLRTMAATTNASIVDAITQDHREIEQYYNNIIHAKDNDEATRWQNQFTWELARHSIAEELVVYPAFEKHLGAPGKAMAEKDREEHQVVKELLKKFQGLKAGSTDFLPTLNELMDNLKQHIKEEENDDLPALASTLSQSDSESMTKSFGRTKAFVPSRSHPSAPSKPPFETVVGLMTAPIDHLGDMLRKFPDQTISPNPSTK